MKGGESRLDTVGPKGLPSAPGSTVPVDRKAADGAPCGDTCLSQRHVNAARRWTAGCAARRSIPLPLQGTEDGPPRGPGKEYGWRSVGCLTIESGNRERKNARAPHSAHSRASGNPALGPRRSLHSGRRSRTRVRGRAENRQHRAIRARVMAGFVIASRIYPTCDPFMRKSGKPDFRCHPRLLVLQGR